MTDRNVLIVRGGWEGHKPVETTELFIPFLREHGYEVRVEESTAVYADADAMAATDLIVQCISMGEASGEEIAGLRDAVAAGTGFTGWHGGIVDSFRMQADYLQLVGGQFASHPSQPVPGSDETTVAVEHVIEMTELGREHPITAGIDDIAVRSEQYWVLTDDLNDVLATTTHPLQRQHPWHRRVVAPAIWTRQWGSGRIVVTTPGHEPETLLLPSVRTIVERGMLWATRDR